MWPMLFELLPHFARLMPMADKYLNGRGASEKAHEAALAALADSVRGDLGQVVEVHSGIQHALQEQAAQISEIAVEGTRTRMGVESIEARIAKLEQTSANSIKLLAVAVVILTATVAVLEVLLSHQLRH
jgi:hypothetical protein